MPSLIYTVLLACSHLNIKGLIDLKRIYKSGCLWRLISLSIMSSVAIFSY